jgi:hypothetical protein
VIVLVLKLYTFRLNVSSMNYFYSETTATELAHSLLNYHCRDRVSFRFVASTTAGGRTTGTDRLCTIAAS